MTTLMHGRRPLQILDMNNHAVDRRSSKRVRASIYEEDGDFQFMRVPKRAKTAEPPETPLAPAAQPARKGRGRPARASLGPAAPATRSPPPSSPPPAPAPSSAPTKRGRPRKVVAVPLPVQEEEDEIEPEPVAVKRPKRGAVAAKDSLPEPAAEPAAPAAQPKGRGRGRTAQKQAGSLVPVAANVQKEEKVKKAQNEADEVDAMDQAERKPTRRTTRTARQPSEQPEAASAPEPPPPRARGKRKRAPQPESQQEQEQEQEREQEQEQEQEPAQVPVPVPEPKQVKKRQPKLAQQRAQAPQPAAEPEPEPKPEPEHEPEHEPQPTPMAIDSTPAPAPTTQAEQVQVHDGSPTAEPARIALPISDTPVINRNKEMRKKAATKGGLGGGRRSSLGVRGRRASSLIDNGHTALPHHEVNSADYYKHIAADGMPEVRRMRVLLTWVGERNVPEKPPLGAANPHALLGARAIVKQVLKDLSSKGELTDWFSRDEGPPKDVFMKPNPKNIEHEEKIVELEARVKRLREEKKSWLALAKPLPEPTPLFPPDDDGMFMDLPDASQIDADDAETLRFLTDSANSSLALAASTKQRLSALTSALGFRVDQLADGVQKLDNRVSTAAREADAVLAMCADSLRRREERERARAGTKNLPVMEVLRSLGRMLPPESDSGSD